MALGLVLLAEVVRVELGWIRIDVRVHMDGNAIDPDRKVLF